MLVSWTVTSPGSLGVRKKQALGKQVKEPTPEAPQYCPALPCRDGRPDAAVAVHPGIVQTSMAKDWLMGSDLALGYLQPLTSALFGFLAPVLLASVAGAVRTVVYASLAPSTEVVHLPCSWHAFEHASGGSGAVGEIAG